MKHLSLPTLTARIRASSLADILLWIVAIVASFLIVRRALYGIDLDWDTFAYHLPFAARIGGLCDKACYEFVWWHEDRYAGFPLFATALQSLIWRLAGKPDWNDLVNIAGLAILITAARVTLRAPVALLLTALLTVPLIQIHLSVTYIDLFVNAMIATSFVLLAHAFLDKAAPVWRLLLPLGPVAAAANSKYQMLPIAAALAFGVTALLIVRLRGRPVRVVALAWGAYVVLGLITLATCIINIIVHGNPVFPVAVELFGTTLPGKESPFDAPASLSVVWENTPRFLVWLASVFEVEAYIGRLWVWDLGQGFVSRDMASFRMGGYFGVYVIANLVLFGHLARNTVKPVAIASVGVLTAATLLTAVLPASHELRYYMYWVMMLVVMNTVLATRPELARIAAVQGAHREVHKWLVLIAFAAVAAISNARYLGVDHADVAQAKTQAAGVRARVAEVFVDNKLHCMRTVQEPYRFLFAELFHPGRHYRVRELVGVEPAPPDCDIVIP